MLTGWLSKCAQEAACPRTTVLSFTAVLACPSYLDGVIADCCDQQVVLPAIIQLHNNLRAPRDWFRAAMGLCCSAHKA